MTDAPIADTHPIIPLALLESIRRIDLPARDGLEEFHKELAVKRLGMSQTVAQQIERFQRLAARGARVDATEVEQLLRLIGRRVDADLVFNEAGRRAGNLAVQRIFGLTRAVVRAIPGSAGAIAVGRRATRYVFDMELSRSGGLPAAELTETLNVQATPSGASCAFFGSAVAEILRRLTNFDGAMLHVDCRAKGGAICRWRAAPGAEAA